MSRPGPHYTYLGPKSGEIFPIGHVYYEGPDDPRVRAYVLTFVDTTDLEPAERWWSTLAAGKLPNLTPTPRLSMRSRSWPESMRYRSTHSEDPPAAIGTVGQIFGTSVD